jgi:hypothetical protein
LIVCVVALSLVGQLLPAAVANFSAQIAAERCDLLLWPLGKAYGGGIAGRHTNVNGSSSQPDNIRRTLAAANRFFNDELEPIYQWIPELNKRVYSDKYERFIDKQYQVNEDVDFMLQAYKWMTAPAGADQERDWVKSEAEADGDGGNSILVGRDAKTTGRGERPATPRDEPDDLAAASSAVEMDESQAVASRKLLANRLNRLAKLGSDHSRQLLGSLRSMLAMDDEVSKFRALRLIRPTAGMDGRYTCSISSLDGDDLQSTRLVVYGK